MKLYAFVLPPSQHSELSASSAERWMNCFASPRLCAGLERKTSHYAAEGTAAHHIAAICQKNSTTPDKWLGQMAKVEGFEVEISQEMVAAVQEFLDSLEDAPFVHVEVSLTAALKKLHPKLGGSADRVEWWPEKRLLRVNDLKYGSGRFVSVTGNKQLRIYALGVLLSFPEYAAERVEIVISQPRMDSDDGKFRSETFDAIDLLDFTADILEAVKRTQDPDAAATPGDKQCQWCAAAAVPGRCPSMEAAQHALMKMDFQPVQEGYDVNKLAEALDLLPMLEKRIEAIRQFAYGEAESGVTIPRWKLVEKIGRRKWKSEDIARERITDPKFYKPAELMSPAQVEKLQGKAQFARTFAEYCETVSSGHTLAPEADRRPAVKLISASDFEPVQE